MLIPQHDPKKQDLWIQQGFRHILIKNTSKHEICTVFSTELIKNIYVFLAEHEKYSHLSFAGFDIEKIDFANC